MQGSCIHYNHDSGVTPRLGPSECKMMPKMVETRWKVKKQTFDIRTVPLVGTHLSAILQFISLSRYFYGEVPVRPGK